MPDKNAAKIKHRPRSNPRYAVPWRIVVVSKMMENQETHKGNVCDLSLGGATILTDRNIHSTEHVVATIEIPPCAHNPKRIIVGAKCHILHSIISSDYGKYRIGIGFIEFNGNGKRVLTEALSKLESIISEKSNQPYVLPPC